MDIYERLLEAMGQEPTPSDKRALETTLHVGQVAYLANAVERFDELFGPGQFRERIRSLLSAIEAERTQESMERFKRNMDSCSVGDLHRRPELGFVGGLKVWPGGGES